MEVLDRIIWSADVSNETTLIATLKRMPDLRIVKIDRLFAEMAGLGVIDELNDCGLKVFDDAKLVEIPSKLEALARHHVQHKPFMLNCMACCLSTGEMDAAELDRRDGLKRFADVCLAADVKPCGVTVLTSKSEMMSRREFGQPPGDQVLSYLEFLLAAGFTDVVCSPEEVPLIRKESRFDGLGLNTPGIRPVDSETGDQARVSTPEAALAAGATRLVIGRPITVGDPAANLAAIVASLSGREG